MQKLFFIKFNVCVVFFCFTVGGRAGQP